MWLKKIVAPVGPGYPRFDCGYFMVWATMMECALEANGIWEAVDPARDAYKKGTEGYRKDRQTLIAICSVMPMGIL